QVAMSLVLLVGALLFVRSLHNLLMVDAGFQSEGILSISLDYRKLRYPKERFPGLQRELLERLQTRPGIVSVAQVGFMPVSGAGWNETIRPEQGSKGAGGKDSYFNRI